MIPISKRFGSINEIARLSYSSRLQARIHNVTPQQSASPLGHHQHQQDLQQLRDKIVTLTTQCAQLDEANKAWQLYHATQVDAFRNKLHEHLSLAETGSLDDLAEQIVDQVQREREDAADKYKDFQRVSSDLRGGRTSDKCVCIALDVWGDV